MSADDRMAELWVVATSGKSKPVRLTFDRADEAMSGLQLMGRPRDEERTGDG